LARLSNAAPIKTRIAQVAIFLKDFQEKFTGGVWAEQNIFCNRRPMYLHYKENLTGEAVAAPEIPRPCSPDVETLGYSWRWGLPSW
jgi:hypothetical protein